MKKSIGALIALSVILISGTSASAETRVATSAAQVRNGPSFTHQVITTLPAGSYLDVVGCAEFCKIRFAGRDGWVHGLQTASVDTRERYYEPVEYGWYEIPQIGTVVTVYDDRGRFFYNDRGRRHFIDRQWVRRDHPHRDRGHWHDRREDRGHWGR